MDDRELDYTKCPFCNSVVEIDVEFAIKNERVFCGGCCKAFDIKIQAKTKNKPLNEYDEDELNWYD